MSGKDSTSIHPERRNNWIKINKWKVGLVPFVVDCRKKRPPRVQPIPSLNTAVTNSSDNPVSGANTRPAGLKMDGEPPGLAWQMVLDGWAVWLPANFQLSDNVESMIKDSWINNTSRLFHVKALTETQRWLLLQTRDYPPPKKNAEFEFERKSLIPKPTIYCHFWSSSPDSKRNSSGSCSVDGANSGKIEQD